MTNNNSLLLFNHLLEFRNLAYPIFEHILKTTTIGSFRSKFEAMYSWRYGQDLFQQ